MGIKNLISLAKEYKKDLVKTANLDFFRGKKIALDISIYINKYVCTSRENWITQMCYLLMNLRYNDIQVIIIFDGKYVPPEKEQTREGRKVGRQSQAVRCDKMEALYEKVCTQKLVDEYTQMEVKEMFKRSKVDFSQINLEDPDDVQVLLKEKIEKSKISSEGVQPYHKEITKKLVKGLGFSYIQAYGEAEAMCSSLAYHGLVDAVVSTDSDCLAYGAPILITEIKGGKWTYIELKDVLSALSMEFPTFLDLCICLGCDYNKNMKGCGKKGAYVGMQKYKSLDKWQQQEPNKDFEILIYPKCRKYFKPYSKKYLASCNFKIPGDADPKILDEVLVGTIYNTQYVVDVQAKVKKPGLYFPKTSMLPDI